jgi:periplasmic mercuric ion binding protein
MKTSKIFFLSLLLTIGYSFNAQSNKLVKESFKVWGKCDMCQEKIEDTTNDIEGVKFGRWSIASKLITVKYDPTKTSNEKIQMVIANAGYDTEMYTAKDEDYNSLHFCCKYERK